MSKWSQVEQICREVFEDSVRQARGVVSEPSNKYIAAMREVVQERAYTVGTMEEICLEARSWKDVTDVYVYNHAYIRNAPHEDAGSVVQFAMESILPMALYFVTWIVRQGGWEDFIHYRNEEMDRRQVKQICREVLEDTVRQARGVVSEPSNQYSAAMRKVVHKQAGTYVTLEDSQWESIQRITSDQARSWKDATDVYIYNHALARNAPVGEAESAVRAAINYNLPPLMKCLVPWIVSRGGWEDFLHYLVQGGQ